eukprot:TRINITY_DN2664_c0_g1_i2.p1 TRINITY_DN2664_c0_g1~~TRINITY_DN2664_c0_g1_i2.p1  ORF type:complete len:513 (+),score=141.89 TRINITY_DN2664_c0_g1_i2:55-1593(+)
MQRYIIFLVLSVSLSYAGFLLEHHLSTGSPYWHPKEVTDTPPPAGCKLIYVDLIARHGSRDPTKKVVKTFDDLAKRFQEIAPYVENDHYAWIKNYTNSYSTIRAGFLTYAGELEHYYLAKRLAKRFHPLLSKKYYSNVYRLQNTQVMRTGESASSFAYGLFEGKGDLGVSSFQPYFISTEPKGNDPELRFFEACDRFVNDKTELFMEGKNQQKLWIDKHFTAIGQRITETLGTEDVWQPTNKEVEAMFSACQFELSSANITHRFCSLFTIREHRINEYNKDLKTYYKRAYGNQFNYQIASPLLQAITSDMDAVIMGDSKRKDELAFMRFAHAETVMPLAAILGLYRDDYDLTADLSEEEIRNRKWRSSDISPYAANFVFALYQCSPPSTTTTTSIEDIDYITSNTTSSDIDNTTSDIDNITSNNTTTNNVFKVKLLHNEAEMYFPGCDELYCPYDTFKALYAPSLDFDFVGECGIDEAVANEKYKKPTISKENSKGKKGKQSTASKPEPEDD